MIDSANSFALDRGAQVYYGRPLLNSLNAEHEKLEEAIPIMKKHGAAIVCMTTGTEVPVLATDRLKNAVAIAEELFKHGFREEDFVFDCLGLVVSAMQDGSRETLRTLELVKERFPYSATTLGLSNVSFGLPNRSFVHNAFLALAVERGLDSAIMSVTDPIGPVIAASAAMWTKKAGTINHYMQNFSEKIAVGAGHGASATAGGTAAPKAEVNPAAAEPESVAKMTDLERATFRSIVDGRKDETERLAREFVISLHDGNLDLGMKFFLEVMTPAIRHLGNLFAARVKFIPHLIAAADAMKAGVAVLEPYLLKARKASGQTRGTVIFATVKGDIHDIGKNICILMLRNFGFEVVDLGRNVDPELILSTAIEKKAEVLALSALMTTTMMQMKIVIDAVKERKLPFKVVIGGAVVTPDFAREIQADGYSTDVGTVVSEMERVIAVLDAAR
jgi:5-methyltetrahydrofolate--homocysteine methyltransferase